jgi:hypothetical protein
MHANLDKLRFLRRASDEGLISQLEHEQHRTRLLRSILNLSESSHPLGSPDFVSCVVEATDKLPTTDDSNRHSTWQMLIAALIDVLECNADGRKHERAAYVRNAAASKVAVPRAAMPWGRRPQQPRITPAVAPSATNATTACEHGAADEDEPPAGSVLAREQDDRSPMRSPASRYTYNRSGRHRDTHEAICSMDPLVIPLESLFKVEEPSIAPGPSQPQLPRTTNRRAPTLQDVVKLQAGRQQQHKVHRMLQRNWSRHAPASIKTPGCQNLHKLHAAHPMPRARFIPLINQRSGAAKQPPTKSAAAPVTLSICLEVNITA